MTLQGCPRCPEMHRRAQAAESETARVRKTLEPYYANIQRHCDEKAALRRRNNELRVLLSDAVGVSRCVYGKDTCEDCWVCNSRRLIAGDE